MMMVNHPNRRAHVGRVSKIKSEPEGWRVCIDGQPTALEIVKGDIPPRYRERQEYHVMVGDAVLFATYGVGQAMSIIDTILSATEAA